MLRLFFLISVIVPLVLSAQVKSLTVLFLSGSFVLSESAILVLDSVPNGKVLLKGYTDTEGDVSSNFLLAKKRVMAVKKELVARGFELKNIKTKVYGEVLSDGEKEELQRKVVLKYHKNPLVLKNSVKQMSPVFYRNDRGVVIKTKRGAVVRIPPNVFSERGVMTIRIEVSEYVTKSDFLLAGLDARADEGLLESAGMYKIEAFVGQRKVILKKGVRIVLEVSKKTDKKGYQLFYGERDSVRVLWSQPVEERRQRAVLRRSVVGESRIKRLGSNEIWDLYTVQSDSYVLYKGEYVVLNGKVLFVKVEELYGLLDSLEKKKLIERIPKIKFTRFPIKTRFTFEIPVGNLTDSIRDVLDKRVVKEFREKTYADLSNADIGKLVYSVSKLGWINCDRFYKVSKDEKIEVIVDTEPGVMVRLVFPAFNSLLNGVEVSKGRYSFGEVPKGVAYKILAYKLKNSSIYVAESNRINHLLVYRLVSKDEFIDLVDSYN